MKEVAALSSPAQNIFLLLFASDIQKACCVQHWRVEVMGEEQNIQPGFREGLKAH